MSRFAPLKILQTPYSVILLNHNGYVDDEGAVAKIWNNAKSRIAVDGGTNLWYDLYQSCKGTLKEPNYVSGDFDSILPHVLTHVKTLNAIQVIHTPDQDETDFSKALQIILNDEQSPKVILALINNRVGRLDQLMANLNTLIKSLNCDLILYDHRNVMFALPASQNNSFHEIELKSNVTCGVIPMCGDTYMKSQGLKWDLDDTYGFGQVVSSSNETKQNVIQLQANRPIIFSASYCFFN